VLASSGRLPENLYSLNMVYPKPSKKSNSGRVC
jgi:hypothetical protein